MITGFHDLATAESELRTWAAWDSVRAEMWELVSFPRTCTPSNRAKGISGTSQQNGEMCV